MGQLFSTEQVNQILAPYNISLDEEWLGINRQNRFKCMNGHTWSRKGKTVLCTSGGKKCPFCHKRNKPLEFTRRDQYTAQEVNLQLAPKGIKLNGPWNGWSKKSEFICAYGHIWETAGSVLLRHGSNCPNCMNRAKLSEDQVNARLAPRGIRLLGKWHGMGSPNTFICAEEHIWVTNGQSTASDGHGCPECNGKPLPPLTNKEVNSRLFDAGKGVTLVDDWQGGRNDNTFRCELGHEWVTTGWNPVTYGKGCPECWRLRIKNRHAND